MLEVSLGHNDNILSYIVLSVILHDAVPGYILDIVDRTQNRVAHHVVRISSVTIQLIRVIYG